MARCDEKARGEETAANCRGSSIVAKFAPRFHARYHVFSLPSLAFLPDFLPPVIAIRTKKGKRKDRNYIYYCFAINGGRVRVRTILRKGRNKKKKGRWNEKRRGLVIMACSERSRHSRPYSARNKRRTSVSRERIELGMQQVKQPLLPPFYSNEIPFRRDFLKVSYFFTNYTYIKNCQNSLLIR